MEGSNTGGRRGKGPGGWVDLVDGIALSSDEQLTVVGVADDAVGPRRRCDNVGRGQREGAVARGPIAGIGANGVLNLVTREVCEEQRLANRIGNGRSRTQGGQASSSDEICELRSALSFHVPCLPR